MAKFKKLANTSKPGSAAAAGSSKSQQSESTDVLSQEGAGSDEEVVTQEKTTIKKSAGTYNILSLRLHIIVSVDGGLGGLAMSH